MMMMMMIDIMCVSTAVHRKRQTDRERQKTTVEEIERYCIAMTEIAV